MSRLVRFDQLPSEFRNNEYVRGYTDKHWGNAPSGVMHYDDGLKIFLEGWGRVVDLHLREPRKLRDTKIVATRAESMNSELSYDPKHANQRLYICMSPAFKNRMRETYVAPSGKKKNPASKYGFLPLGEVAEITGGRHAHGRDYPNVEVTPLGTLTHVTYATDKKPDGFSWYIHQLGEETGIRPFLTVDRTGQLWIAGGDYWGDTAGINN
jgi:hypothetical protein